MVRAEFSRSDADGSITLVVNGHAGAAKEGEDIVCSSASILAYTAAQTLRFMYEDGGLKEKPTIRVEKGDALIVAKPNDDRYKEALHTFFVVQVGFLLLSRNYPEFVSLKSFGESEGT